ncbi:GGDEF domain family protein [Desulforapulum autotrophicum HRM2]|uniref:GGDEF domain family protein n=1 Tax=Desulforapulum autotrophicum (strain ATCC 43914 / DSM 3382 / VKM B-1955 / HRM2) TaxID=177437 RepID=C0QBD5_DESAH|nr:diguanylate cyclase [Desulforapulum autotrophicum]ACN16937.1 GGDEF domain family protein [Desulforapulum autotrophicum HRM2]
MINDKKTITHFFAILLIFVSVLAGSISLIYFLEAKDHLKRLKLEEQMNLKLQLALTSKNFETIISDLLFLSEQNELLDLIKFNDKTYKVLVSNEYLTMARTKKTYDQIRYLDNTGMEIVRVNFNNGNPEIVKDPDLQFKGDRYYFKETFMLDANGIFVSPLDLNIEHGSIETPLKPIIRFGIPVFNENQQKCGVILINYLAGKMLATIGETARLSPGKTMLINPEGFWLLSPDKDEEWGFMIKGRQDKNFSKKFPEEWNKIASSKSYQTNDRNGLFTSATIYPLRQEEIHGLGPTSATDPVVDENRVDVKSLKYYWKLVSYIPRHDLNSGMRSLFLKLLFMAIALLPVTTIPSWLIAKAIIRRKSYLIELYRSANYDKLTDLPNRAMFMDRFNEIFKQSRRYKRKLALLFIDLDGFKSVNDTLGHDAGDELLIEVAKRLKGCVRDSDVVARLGGDEFTVIFSTITSLDDPKLGAQKILQNLAAPFSIKGHDTRISASIGMSIYPDHGNDIEVLLKKADNAMYLAKEAGKNNYKLSPV